jgi:hypothetical protein
MCAKRLDEGQGHAHAGELGFRDFSSLFLVKENRGQLGNSACCIVYRTRDRVWKLGAVSVEADSRAIQMPRTIDESSAQRMEDQMTISNQTVERCIEECLQCSRWSGQCRTESLNEDPIMMRDCIRLCNECLELCRACAALLTGSSGFAHLVCGICSELCTACASECGKYDGETMRKCAQACRQCAATCAEVAKAGPIRRAAA